MKELIFKDGSSVSFTDESTITNCVTVLTTFAEIDSIREKFTEDNMKGATFDGEVVENVVPVSCDVSAEVGENAVAVFVNRIKTDAEVVKEQLVEVQELVATM